MLILVGYQSQRNRHPLKHVCLKIQGRHDYYRQNTYSILHFLKKKHVYYKDIYSFGPGGIGTINNILTGTFYTTFIYISYYTIYFYNSIKDISIFISSKVAFYIKLYLSSHPNRHNRKVMCLKTIVPIEQIALPKILFLFSSLLKKEERRKGE